MECDSLPHRRWGARAGVMSVSRPTKKRMGWSATGLTRKLLAKRRIWFAESMTRVQETVEVLIRVCGQRWYLSLLADVRIIARAAEIGGHGQCGSQDGCMHSSYLACLETD